MLLQLEAPFSVLTWDLTWIGGAPSAHSRCDLGPDLDGGTPVVTWDLTWMGSNSHLDLGPDLDGGILQGYAPHRT